MDIVTDGQTAIFQDFWTRFSASIKEDGTACDYPAPEEQYPQYNTTVIRLPEPIQHQLATAAKFLLPDAFHYPAHTIHLTLINIDLLLVGQPSPDWSALSRIIQKELGSLQPLQLAVRGINVFPTGIFAQIYDVRGNIEEYRSRIVQATARLHPGDTRIKAVAPGAAFANLAKFQQRGIEYDFTKVLRAYRERDFGSFSPSALELVTTDRLLSDAATVHRGTIKLSQ